MAKQMNKELLVNPSAKISEDGDAALSVIENSQGTGYVVVLRIPVGLAQKCSSRDQEFSWIDCGSLAIDRPIIIGGMPFKVAFRGGWKEDKNGRRKNTGDPTLVIRPIVEREMDVKTKAKCF